jgi:transposase
LKNLLCRRVVDEDWSLTEAAAAAEVSERTASKWVRRFRMRARRVCWTARRPRTVFKNRTPETPIEAIAALRRLRFTGA